MRDREFRSLLNAAILKGESRWPTERARSVYTIAFLTELLVHAGHYDQDVINRLENLLTDEELDELPKP